MENKRPSFDDTVSVLVKAYLNDTLQHGNCAACAVGNIIASSINAEVSVYDFEWHRGRAVITPIWDAVFCSSLPGVQDIEPTEYKGWTRRQIDASGYTWQELAKIEFAFELKNPIAYEDDDVHDIAMFEGLMSVVDVLAEIHGISFEQKQSAKSLFVKS